jgi:hypothetical protein
MKQILIALALTFLSSTSFADVAVHCVPSQSHAWGAAPAHGESATVDFTMPSIHSCNMSAPVLATQCYDGQCNQVSFRTNECCYSERAKSLNMGVACGESGQCTVVSLNQMSNGDWSGEYYFGSFSSGLLHSTDVICHMSGF